MKSISPVFLLIILIISTFSSCKKSEAYRSPAVDIIAPFENEVIQLPGFVEVQVSVISDRMLEYVRISLDNDQLTPMFAPKFFYPDSNRTMIIYDLKLDLLPPGQQEPFYLHVAVNDGIEINHEYQKVRLDNASLKYKGFYLHTKPMVNRIQAEYYDNQFEQLEFATLDGEFADSDASAQNDMVFIATSKPAQLLTFRFKDQKLLWTKYPVGPYPEYTDLLHSGNRIFASTANGQISALSDLGGNIKVITPELFDSVPLKIGITDEFIIGDFLSRNQPGRTWVMFYKITGQKFQKFQTNIGAVDFYNDVDQDEILVIGNESENGVFVSYQIGENSIGDLHNFNQGLISKSCRVDNEEFIVAIDNRLYQYNITTEFENLIHQCSSKIVDIEFDPINLQLFVAQDEKLEIFSWPAMQLTKTIESANSIKAIVLRFGY